MVNENTRDKQVTVYWSKDGQLFKRDLPLLGTDHSVLNNIKGTNPDYFMPSCVYNRLVEGRKPLPSIIFFTHRKSPDDLEKVPTLEEAEKAVVEDNFLACSLEPHIQILDPNQIRERALKLISDIETRNHASFRIGKWAITEYDYEDVLRKITSDPNFVRFLP